MQGIPLLLLVLLSACAEPDTRDSGSSTFGLYCENQPVTLTYNKDCLGRWVKYVGDESNVLYFATESDCSADLNPLAMEKLYE